MATYRERRLAKAERLRAWSAGRAAKAEQEFEKSENSTAGIPFGQPILVGHHSERRHRNAIRRAQDAASRGVADFRMAERMAERADNIERAAKNAIYSDDPDARERLTEKIAALEGERDRMKAANAAFRKENREMLKGMTAYERHQAVPFPSYKITNMGATIGTARKRLAGLDRTPVDRLICARYAGECADCGAAIERGSMIRYSRQAGARCAECPTTKEAGEDG